MSFFSRLFQRRSTKLRKVALAAGMDFFKTDDHGMLEHLEGFALCSSGRRKEIKNIMVKFDPELGFDMRIFDYRYVVGGGNSTRSVKQTVFYLYSENLNLPGFLMKPETFFQQIGNFLGLSKDINFEEYPEFSKQYFLKGDAEDSIRSKFNDDLLHFFTIEKNWSLEGRNYFMLFYQKGKIQKPETIRDFYQKGLLIYKMLVNQKGFSGYGEFV